MGIKFTRTLGPKGETLGVNIPKELIGYLELKSGDILEMTADEGKHGKFISLWVKKDEKQL